MRTAVVCAALLMTVSTVLVFANGVMPGVSNPARAHSLYQIHCQGCHLPGGEGFPARDVPRLTGHLGYFTLLEEGRKYLVQVPGASGSPIDDEDLAEITNWMIYTFNPEAVTAHFQPYTADEVAKWRHAWQGNIVKRRQALIEALKARDDYPGEDEHNLYSE